MGTQLGKFSSQASPELLAAVRGIARKEGVDFPTVLEDACGNTSKTASRKNAMSPFWSISTPA